MKALKNKVQLIGHVGKDPIIKDFEGGKKCIYLIDFKSFTAYEKLFRMW